MSHHCHARGCKREVKPELLMCFPHWNRVPRKIQRAVWATYREGQCDDMSPSEEWHVAANAAIGAVAIKEGHYIRVCELNALNKHGFSVREKLGGLEMVEQS